MTISRKMRDQMERASWIRKMFEEAARLRTLHGSDAVLDLSLGNPIEEPPPQFVKALQAETHMPPSGCFRYMSNSGYADTRAAVAQFAAREQCVPLTEEHIVMTCGAAGALNVALKALIDPGDEVLILAPYFVEYLSYIDNHGGTAVVVETDDVFLPDAARIEQAITSRTKAILINSPNNPTGVVYSREVVRQIAQVLSDQSARIGHPIYLISDEVYRHVVYDGTVPACVLSEYCHAILATSFSKSLGLAGERLGYLALSPRIEDCESLAAACATANRILGFVNAPGLMQRCIRTCLDATVRLDLYRHNRDILYNALLAAGLQIAKPMGAFYLFPRCPTLDDVAYCDFLRSKGIIAVPGCGFGRGGHVRLAYSIEREMAIRAAERIATLKNGFVA